MAPTTLQAALFEADLLDRVSKFDRSSAAEFCAAVYRDLHRLKRSVALLEQRGDTSVYAAKIDFQFCKIEAQGACDAALDYWAPDGRPH
ncbi:hypothetical protein [Hyphomicrobium sp. D-2]|uniref:hypothetical protein n=1 Tax=Hyphomicrobium sp. D-2 TaxID=3041621 RepID=UPI0024557C2F|nr:hypothetical protein [Hyphomicrobium sp. D-2]MDH4981462.1 hypothetical protein [Hyphomicrobium sp. D-2]